MKKFFNLFNFEFNRFFKIYGATLCLIFIAQTLLFGSSLWEAYQKLQVAIKQTGGNINEVHQLLNTPYTMNNFLTSGPYRLMVSSIMFVLFFYVFYTWYRDWLGKNTFIYRLLMLPINRMQIFWSKSLVFLVGGLSYIAFQYITVSIYQMIALWLIPNDFITALPVQTIIKESYAYSGFPPTKPFDIFLTMGFCFLWLTHFTVVILLERSYRAKGLIAGIFYIPLMAALQFSVFIFNFPLLVSEVLLYTIAFSFASWLISLLVIYYLIRSKVTV